MERDKHTFFDAQTIEGGASNPTPDSKSELEISAGDSARIDRFTLLAAIGQGGMGELYAAYDAKLDRKVALKLVRAGRGSTQADSRLLREAQALAKISHPNVVPVFDVGSTGNRVFVAMEYVRGKTLGTWLEQLEDEPESARVQALLDSFHQAALGLAAVHEVGLAHRDFKPDNVIVGDDERVRLVDFGLARNTSATSESSGDWVASGLEEGELLAGLEINELLTPNIEVGKLTHTGTLIGTPRYMAPEQWKAQRGDSRSDQFSFCVALFHALYDSWPYEGETLEALKAAMLEGSPRELPRVPAIPASLRAALSTGLAREPEQRSEDMRALIGAIEDTLRPEQRRRVLLAVLVVLSLILFAAVARVVFPPAPPSGADFNAMIASITREAEAERQRVAVVEQIAVFDAEGEFERGDEVFEAFAGLRDNARTRALARAWLGQGERLGARGLRNQQLAALGEALLASAEDGGRRDALLALARVQAAAHEYRRLGATLLVLADEPGNGELLTMRVREALNRRSLSEALEALERPEVAALAAQLAPLIRQLDQVTRTENYVAARNAGNSGMLELAQLDLDGDSHGELLLIDHEQRARLLASEPELRSLQEVALPLGSPKQRHIDAVSYQGTRADAPSWISTGAGAGRALVELSVVEGRVEARALVVDEADFWTAGDLFSGAGWTGWEAIGTRVADRRITGVRTTQDAVEVFTPSPSLEVLDSYVGSLLVTDLDGDGSEELIAAVDGWWAYDLRVLSPSAEPGHFELAARRKIGGQSGLVSFPAPTGSGRWLALTVPETSPAPRVFESDAPSGAAPGVYILAWAGPGQGLELIDQLALPSSFSPRAGDLDGDGKSELVVELLDGLVILQPGEDLDETAIWIAGLRSQALADLDHDGDDELIVSDADTGQVLVLGSGAQQLPSLPPPIDPRIPPESDLDPELRELWARAETLAMVGLLDQSRAAFAKLASLASADSARCAHQRSAALLERDGARSLAAPLYEAAGDPASLEQALELYRTLHQFGDAARVAARLAAPADASARARARAVTLARWAEPETTLEFDLSAPLDEGWRISQPGMLRSSRSGLRIDLLNSPDPVLVRRAFEWDGDHLELEFDIDIEHLEWGSMVHVDLVPVDDSGLPAGPRLARLRVASVGGGGHYVLDRFGHHALEPGSINETPRMRGAKPEDAQRHIRVRLDVTGDAPRGWVVVETSAPGGPASALAYQLELDAKARRPGRYELQIATGPDLWMRGVVRLERLRLAGAREDRLATPLTRREQVLLALANADSAGVLELIHAAQPGELEPRDAGWIEALALEQLGRWPEAQPLIKQALGDCEDPEAIARFAYGLLLIPDRFGPPLREHCSRERFLTATWEVAWGALFHHPDLRDVHRTTTTQLVDLDACEPQNYEQARACADLLTARSRGWYMQNQGAAADTDLRRALDLVDEWMERPELSLDQSHALRRIGALAHVRLAAVLVIRNQLDEAELELAAALESDLAPEIMADVIVARRLFAPVHERPIWARVLATQSGLD